VVFECDFQVATLVATKTVARGLQSRRFLLLGNREMFALNKRMPIPGSWLCGNWVAIGLLTQLNVVKIDTLRDDWRLFD
jgi:hypothetical protein